MGITAFRVDASVTIGSGHLMRCLTLGDALKARGASIHFICRDLSAVYASLITQQGFVLHALPADKSGHVGDSQSTAHAHWLGVHWREDAQASINILRPFKKVDLLVIDHYAIDARWERYVRSQVNRVLVVDDLADRPHDCDVLLDQNFHVDQETRYSVLVSDKTHCLYGPQHALVHRRFSRAREAFPRAEHPSQPAKRVNICFGGVDATGETFKALDALKPWIDKAALQVDVILGAASPHRETLEEWTKHYSAITLHISPDNLAELLAMADIGIGAAGGMSWERACVGLPSIVISIAPNQRCSGQGAGESGMHLYIGESQKVSMENLRSAIEFLISNPSLRRSLADSSLRLVDGQGARRVARYVLPPDISLRQVSMRDCEEVFTWRNDPVNRRYAHDSNEISREDHRRWFEQVIEAEDRFLLIGSDRTGAVGVLRYDLQNDHWLTSVYLVPGRHNKGLGAPLLAKGLDWLKSNCKGRAKVHAEILSDNVISEAAFQHAGYQKRFSTFVAELSTL